MKRKINIILLFIVAVLWFQSCTQQPIISNTTSKVFIEVQFNNENIHYANVDWKQGLTALEALQYAEKVETHPVGEYVFVSKIDTAENVRGVKAWYYKINGKSADKLAIWNDLSAGDTLTWIYKQDVCSGTKE